MLQVRRAWPQRSLPPCGGGTGRGVRHNAEAASNPRSNAVPKLSEVSQALSFVLCRHPSPCPSPTRGEGTVGPAPSQLISGICDGFMLQETTAECVSPSVSILQLDLALGDHGLPLFELGFQNVSPLRHGCAARL